MISRVAENCFWLSRYMERADTMARLLAVNRVHILDSELNEGQSWRPVVIVAGEQERFENLLGEKAYENTEKAEEYLTWDERNPTSVYSSFAGARENARTTREVISREVWETINSTWRWLNEPAARKLYKKDRQKFFAKIRSVCAEHQGNCHDTLLHEEAFDFLKFGSWLERAAQTARVMDVRHHWLTEDSGDEVESPQESAQWMGLLRLCSAVEPFFKRHTAAPTGTLVVRFLLADRSFPRSVLFSLLQVEALARHINQYANESKPNETSRLASEALERITQADFSRPSSAALHATLTDVIESTSGICEQASRDYFHGHEDGHES